VKLMHVQTRRDKLNHPFGDDLWKSTYCGVWSSVATRTWNALGGLRTMRKPYERGSQHMLAVLDMCPSMG
jgi:hypothetical protein